MIEVLSKGYKQIVIGQLGDLFHSSQIKKSVTMAGTQLDDGDMTISELLSQYKKGLTLVKECAEMLDSVENEVQQIIEEVRISE